VQVIHSIKFDFFKLVIVVSAGLSIFLLLLVRLFFLVAVIFPNKIRTAILAVVIVVIVIVVVIVRRNVLNITMVNEDPHIEPGT